MNRDDSNCADGAARRRKLAALRWVDKICLVGGLGLLAFVVTRFPMSSVLEACARVGPMIAVTPFIALGWFCSNARGLHTLLGRRVPWRVLLWNRLVGDGYNALLPLGGFGGEPFKLRHLSQYIPAEQALAGMLRERLTENAVGFSFSAIWLTIGISRFKIAGALRAATLTYVVIAVSIAVFYVLVLTTRLPGRVSTAATRWLGLKSEAVDHLPRSLLAQAALWYLVGRFLGLLEIGALFRLLSLPTDPVTLGFAYSAVQAVGFIAFLIPQGLGVFEGCNPQSCPALFALLGFPGALGVAFIFARRGRLLLVGLFGVLLHLLARFMGAGRVAVQRGEP